MWEFDVATAVDSMPCVAQTSMNVWGLFHDAAALRYLLVGLGNTVLGLSIIFLLRQVVNDFAANFAAYFIVVPISFITHRNISFRDRGKKISAYIRYMVVVLVGYAINVILLGSAINMGINEYAAQTMAIVAYVFVTYGMTRLFVFTKQ
jgi:putative flippase GtrA